MKTPTRLAVAVSLGLLCMAVSEAENKQDEGEKLVRQADKISNIRSTDALAFRLKASFRCLGDGAPAGEGTYTETWVSHGQWRRETTLADFHRIEVGGTTKRWVSDNTPEVPGKAGGLGALMRVVDFSREPKLTRVAAIRDETVQGLLARCVELKGNNLGKETLCFDVQAGVLLLRKTPTLWMGGKSEYSCQYSEYEQFAGRMYPHHIQCTEGTHPGIDVRLLELSSVQSPDAALFHPLPGAKELENCAGKIQAPKAIQTLDAGYPKGESQPSSPDVLYLTVGIDGRPHDLKVARSIGAAFDKAALDAVSRWTFKPAACDGEPVPVELNIEVTFHKY